MHILACLTQGGKNSGFVLSDYTWRILLHKTAIIGVSKGRNSIVISGTGTLNWSEAFLCTPLICCTKTSCYRTELDVLKVSSLDTDVLYTTYMHVMYSIRQRLPAGTHIGSVLYQ